MSLSVVFDSAGTLMKTIRAVFCAETQSIISGAETTLLVFEDSDRSLVLLNTGASAVFSAEDMPLSSWLSENAVSYAVSCGKATHEEAGAILLQDRTVTTRNLQSAAAAVKAEAEKETKEFALNCGVILNCRTGKIEYLVASAGYLFSGTAELMQALQKKGVNICIASGDRQEKLEAVAARLAVPKENVFGAASPEKKADVIFSLQNRSETVIMIGDAVNDLPAFHAADFAVLTVQQRGRRPDILFDAADAVIEDIRDAEEIVRRFL